jgi:hypothetical protein
MPDHLNAALELAQRDLRVFPLWPGTKKPRTTHGLKDGTVDPFVITEWWSEEPELNIAVVTGEVSGIFVVDIDSLDAESELTKLETEHGKLPATVESITARGRHVWLKCPAGRHIRNSAGRIAANIDVRGDGGFVVAPPSLHPSGKRYAWSVDSASAFADAPLWLLEKICPSISAKPAATPPTEWRELFEASIGEGSRDCTMTRLAGYLLRRFIDPWVVLSLLRAWNSTHCDPPLPDADISRIVNSVCGLELKRRGAQ